MVLFLRDVERGLFRAGLRWAEAHALRLNKRRSAEVCRFLLARTRSEVDTKGPYTTRTTNDTPGWLTTTTQERSCTMNSFLFLQQRDWEKKTYHTPTQCYAYEQ